MTGLEHHVDRARVAIWTQDLRPVGSAIRRLEETALRVRTVGVPECGDIDDVRVMRVDLDAPDLLRVAQAHELPGMAAVARAVHPVTLGDVRAHVGLAGSHEDHARVRWGDREGADRAYGHGVEDRLPGAAGIESLPDSSVDRSEVEVVGLAGDARDGQHAPASERTDEAPLEILKQGGIHRTGESGSSDQQNRGGEENPAHFVLLGNGWG